MLSGGGYMTGDVTVPIIAAEEKEPKLQSVNRFLRRLQEQNGAIAFLSARSNTSNIVGKAEKEEHIMGSSNSNSNSNNPGNDDEPVSSAGIFVTVDRHLSEGTMVLSCGSEGFVLESPEVRRHYCSYCGCCYRPPTNPSSPSSSSSLLVFCPDCRDCHGNPMVGYCSDCTDDHTLHHVENLVECRVLQCLRASITPPNNSDDSDEIAITNHCIREIFGSSVALLTIKLLSRKSEARKTDSGRAVSESSWWDDFELLYEHPLPPDSPYSAIVVLLAAAMDAVVPASASSAYTHEQVVRSTVGRVLGCSHAIVDPSLPLGKQTLGRAVYAGHSFFNHSCAPNAYLSSTFLVNNKQGPAISDDSDSSSQKLLLTASVHLLRPVSEGAEITLSYLPLSGLLKEERQESLEKNYGFRCNCQACCGIGCNDDKNHRLMLLSPPNHNTHETTSQIDSIREIQFGLNDRLLDLSARLRKLNCHTEVTNRHERTRACNYPFNENESEGEMIALEGELMSILGTIDMTQRGIQNQILPECHEVSIESDRLAAKAWDLWLALTAATASTSRIPTSAVADTKRKQNSILAGKKHREFFRKTAKIRELFDPVALGTQCLAYYYSLITRLCSNHHYRGMPKRMTENESRIDSKDYDECDDYDDVGEEFQHAESERNRGLKILATCLGRDHPWVRKLRTEKTLSARDFLPNQGNGLLESPPPSSLVEPKDAKRRRI